LPLHDLLFNGTVSRKVDGLVATLAQHGGYHALVERARAFFLDNEHGRLQDIGVLAVLHSGRIHHGVILRLHPNFADFGGGDNEDGFGQTGEQPRREGNLRRVGLVGVSQASREELPILLERYESDGHFGNDSGINGRESLVECEESFPLHDASGGADGSQGCLHDAGGGSRLWRKAHHFGDGRTAASPRGGRNRLPAGFVEALRTQQRLPERVLQPQGRFDETVADLDDDLFHRRGLPTQLHAGLNGVQWMTDGRLDETGTSSRNQVLQGVLLRRRRGSGRC
jgi:hypothetical protein